jgi:amino acid permease
MVLQLRRPDRKRFRSPLHEARRRQREYYYAAVSVLVVKIVLLVFLCVLLYVSLQLFPRRFAEGPFFAKYGVPILAACFIVVLGRFIYNNIKDLRESRVKRGS